MNNREQIRAFIASLLARKADTESFLDDDSLLLSGRIDSLNVLEIAAFLVDQLGFDLSTTEFDQEHFDSVDSLVAYVEGR
jgi:acyl carrier protein